MRKFCPVAPSGATSVHAQARPKPTRKLARKPAPASKPYKPRKPVCLVPSLKAGLVGVTRHWHQDLPLLLDADPTVVAFTADTTRVTFEFEGEERTFRPDLEVEYRSGRVAIAILTEAEAAEPVNVATAVVLRTFYAGRGMGFRMVTERDLKAQPQLDNARALFRHRHLTVSMEKSFLLAKAVAEGHAATLGDLHQALGGDTAAWAALLTLAAQGCIEVNLDAPLDASNPVLRVTGRGGAV